MPISMVAVVTARAGDPCVVRLTKRVRLHVEAFTYCGLSVDLGDDGALQVPGHAKLCEHCLREIETSYPK
jgi:hypothetical protein